MTAGLPSINKFPQPPEGDFQAKIEDMREAVWEMCDNPVFDEERQVQTKKQTVSAKARGKARGKPKAKATGKGKAKAKSHSSYAHWDSFSSSWW
eukprot:11447269-Karenia_brevis.AAC.1